MDVSISDCVIGTIAGCGRFFCSMRPARMRCRSSGSELTTMKATCSSIRSDRDHSEILSSSSCKSFRLTAALKSSERGGAPLVHNFQLALDAEFAGQKGQQIL